MTEFINDTVASVLTHLQENYGHLMPHKLLEREDIVNKTINNPRNPITNVFSAFEELLKFINITRTSYTQLQVVNISYVILHRTGKFELEVSKWNFMPTIKKMWVCFKPFFLMSHRELREMSDVTVENAEMHHANMVSDVVAGIDEALQQGKTQTETLTSVQAHVYHVANTVQSTQQQLAKQLQKIQSMMQTIQMHYNSVTYGTHQDCVGRGYHSNQSSYNA